MCCTRRASRSGALDTVTARQQTCTVAKGKADFPVSDIRRYLEPGPIVLVSSAWRGRTNIMTMGWHTVMEFVPSLVGCMISAGNHSHEMIRRSGECTINVPTAALTSKVVGIGKLPSLHSVAFGRCASRRRRRTRPRAPSLPTTAGAGTHRACVARRPRKAHRAHKECHASASRAYCLKCA